MRLMRWLSQQLGDVADKANGQVIMPYACGHVQGKVKRRCRDNLHEMFGGQSTLKEFKRKFPADLTAARVAYQDARLEEHEEGYLFRYSLPPIPKTKLLVHKSDRT
jgi:hypothetical protein